MLRAPVGWVRYTSESWHETMSRMRLRVERAPRVHSVMGWSFQVKQGRGMLQQRWSRMSPDKWPRLCTSWVPSGHRNVGRPLLRWTDSLI